MHRLEQRVKDGQRIRAIVLGSGDRIPRLQQEADRILPVIKKFADVVLTDFEYSESLDDVDCELAIVLGGDGSILRSARYLLNQQIPVLGVNLGRLGFLADVLPAELPVALEDIVAGRFRVIGHLMLHCQVFCDGVMEHEAIGLNELAVLSGPPFSIQQIELYVDGELATTYRCDGLIISTPVGSTAHNLSAGGPILRKNLQAFVISPISPHTLTVRPVVDTADRVYEIIVREPNESTSAVLDGQRLCPLTKEHLVRIQRAQTQFQLVQVQGHSYYRTLREKLGWSGGFERHRS